MITNSLVISKTHSSLIFNRVMKISNAFDFFFHIKLNCPVTADASPEYETNSDKMKIHFYFVSRHYSRGIYSHIHKYIHIFF